MGRLNLPRSGFGLAGAVFFTSLEFMFPPAALSEPLTLNCSGLVRTDATSDGTGKLLTTTTIATAFNDAVTQVTKVTLDISSLTMHVLEPGSQEPVNYSPVQVTDSYIFGKISYYADPVTPGDTSPLTIVKLVNIDRSSGAFRQLANISTMLSVSWFYTQFVGTSTKGTNFSTCDVGVGGKLAVAGGCANDCAMTWFSLALSSPNNK